MLFESKLPKLPLPKTDVFNYIFHEGRRNYPGDRVLYRENESDKTLTLDQLEDESKRLGKVLATEYSVKPGDVVAILALDQIKYPVTYFSALVAGATVALIPVQKNLSTNDVASRLVQGEAKVIFTDADCVGLVESASELAGVVPIITMEKVKPYLSYIDQLIDGVSGGPNFGLSSHEEAGEAVAFINRTSGSSGKMKSVLTTHAHFIGVLDSTRATVPSNTNPDRDVWTSTLSLGFFICAKLFLGLNIVLGIPVVFLRKPLDQDSLDVVEENEISLLFITPPLAANLAKADSVHNDFSAIKWVLSAGAPMHESPRDSVKKQMNNTPVTLEWATTETLLLAIQISGLPVIQGSSGTLANGVEAKVIHTETGEELGPNEEGELLVRNSLARFAGYKDDEVANRDFDSEGFFHTGDVGYLDENCNVFIKDRLKELLRVGDGYGSRISTSELEAVLFEHPAIASAVVVGVQDQATLINQPTAFIILKPEINKTAELITEIEEFADERLTGLKRLSGGIHVMTKYPNIGFKIDRKSLKTLVHIEDGKVTPRSNRSIYLS